MIGRVQVFVRALKIVFTWTIETKFNVSNNSLDGGCPFTTFLYFSSFFIASCFCESFSSFWNKEASRRLLDKLLGRRSVTVVVMLLFVNGFFPSFQTKQSETQIKLQSVGRYYWKHRILFLPSLHYLMVVVVEILFSGTLVGFLTFDSDTWYSAEISDINLKTLDFTFQS